MTVKTGTVMARIEPDVKDKAEAILATLGVTSSGLINMLYRQIILTNGIPFPITLPPTFPCLDNMTEDELSAMLEKGAAQARSGRCIPIDEAFAALENSIR